MAANGSDDDQTRSFTNLTAGTQVAHYKIISKIGAGGMGEVYLAEDTRLSRNVALKFLPQHLCQDDASRTRFTREAKAAAKLDHPNIVPIHEVGEFQGRPFFSMAHIEGKSLREIIKQGNLTVHEAVDLTMQVCEGLHEAHSAGVVHRDIKPGNIIIDKKGKPRLLDFGLATVSGEEKLTKTGSTLGTVGYMSPEQVEGKKTDHRSDLFSVGVILYEMLTGRRPFEADTDAAVARSITDTTPEPIARYKSGTTGELQQTVDKALTKDPALRYQSADGMLADLKRIALVSAPSRKSRIGLWAAITAVVAIAGILGITQPWTEKSDSHEPEKIMLAVLPFEHLGKPDDEYFADGITEEITSRLGMIRELGVISRTSAMQYKGTDKSLPQIAKELGVDYILEGTVRWDKRGDTDVVRITPQLIGASDNTHIWTDIYEEGLTSVFQVQASIASDIAAALDVTLLESVREAMQIRPTDNKEAYTAYLHAVEYDRLPENNSNNFDRAILMYERAIELDSNFALAWAGLSNIHTRYFSIFDKSDKRLSDARKAAERSLAINPRLAEGHLALASVHTGNWQYDSALIELDLAETFRPSLARIYNDRAVVFENKSGFTEESLKEVLRAEELDPLDGYLLEQIAEVYYHRREIDKCMEYMDKGIALSPHEPGVYVIKAYMLYTYGVNLDEARKIFDHPVVQGGWTKYALEVEIAYGNFDLALEMLDKCDYEWPQQKHHFRKRRAWVKWLMGDTAAARDIYDSIRIQYEGYIVEEDRSNERVYVMLSECYGVLGRPQEAIQSIEKACEYRSNSYYQNMNCREDRAKVYTIIGEYDRAIDELEEVLSGRYYLGVPALKVHPTWDPLRNHPRFQALIEKYEKIHGT
jgi:serine/threonine protein kinase/tetratricopeptide (TPR) repeat protein